MSRSYFKGPFLNSYLNKKLQNQFKESILIKIYQKNCLILPEYITKILKVYNGKNWILLKINENMVGLKIGMFIFTRAVYKHKKK